MSLSCHGRLVRDQKFVANLAVNSKYLFGRATKMHFKAALVDLSGTIHVEDEPTPNAISAMQRLRSTGIHIKFVTNTTKESGDTLYNRLTNIGFELKRDEIYSSLSAASKYVQANSLHPFYLVSDDALREFPESSDPYDSVVVGLAPEKFNYANMNKAFNILLEKGKLIAIHQGKYYKKQEGLALGPGCFIKGLEYSAGVSPVIIGKPNRYFFESALPKGVSPSECVMIGDDFNDDVAGAMQIGMKGILVKTGKYRPDVKIDTPPTAILNNFSEAVDWIEHCNADSTSAS